MFNYNMMIIIKYATTVPISPVIRYEAIIAIFANFLGNGGILFSQGRFRINCSSAAIHEYQIARTIETGIILKKSNIKFNIASPPF